MKFWKKSLMARLVGYYLVLSLVMVGLVGFVAFTRAREALKESVFNRLEAVSTLKEDVLNRWIDDQRRDVVFVAWLPEIGEQAGLLLSRPESSPEFQTAYSILSEYLKFLVTSTSDSARTGPTSRIDSLPRKCTFPRRPPPSTIYFFRGAEPGCIGSRAVLRLPWISQWAP